MNMQRKVLSHGTAYGGTLFHRAIIILGICTMFVSVLLLHTNVASARTVYQTPDIDAVDTRDGFSPLHTITVEELLDLTNKDRVDAGLPVLTINQELVNSSELKVKDMATRGYFAHVTPEGKSPWYWFALAGYNYHSAGENLAVDFIGSSAIEDAWMKSPSHRKNILNSKYTEIGISLSSGYFKGRHTIFVVEHFGNRRTSHFQF